MTGEERAASRKLAEWRRNPCRFVWENFHVDPDPWQAEFLDAFADPHRKRYGLVACKGPGKTAGMSWAGWNFLATRPSCKVPCTSITGDNLDDCLWAEFKKWQNKSEFLTREFEWTATRIYQRQHPETWWASARTWPRNGNATEQANTLAGLHEDYLLFLIDEVSDIPDGVVHAAEASLSGGIETKMVIAGNCTRTAGPLYRAAGVDSHLYFLVRITGDPDDPKRSPRINKEEAQLQIDRYGRDSYIVRVNILGQFPLRQTDKLIDLRDCEEAQLRGIPGPMFKHEARIIGLDVARYGDDAATLCARQGLVAFPIKEHRGLDTVELGDILIKAIEGWDADKAFIDGTGIGAGVVDHCRHRGYGNVIQEVNFGASASEPERFENKRAEMYWNTAEWVHRAALPVDPQLAEELAAPVYWYDKKQRVCLLPKDEIKALIGRSPDRADGLVLTHAGPVRPRLREGSLPYEQTRRRAHTLHGHDYDPFAERRA